MPSAHPVPTSPARVRVPPPIHLALSYVGFRNAPNRREYLLRAQWGEEAREFTVWIANTAFAMRQALLQDGPDICFQKLRRELAESEPGGVACVGVTESDLASYREAHAPPTRRPFPSSSPIRRDGRV
jgi:hypothetical protein